MSAEPDVACARGSDSLEAIAVPPTINPTAMGGMDRAVVRSPGDLRLHPALSELGWTGVIDELNEATRNVKLSVTEPILITTNGTIFAGFGRWRAAVLGGDPRQPALG